MQSRKPLSTEGGRREQRTESKGAEMKLCKRPLAMSKGNPHTPKREKIENALRLAVKEQQNKITRPLLLVLEPKVNEGFVS